MAYTGYLVNVYMDANPYSETYGQERTERVLDTENCPVQKPANYVEIYTYCEMTPNGAYTGNCVKVYEDVEPMSATYGQQREEVYTDGVLCPPDSSEADWQQIDQYCEQIAYQPSGKLGNSGYQITVFQDMGSFSPTYNQRRETRTEDLVHCPLPDTSDVWVIISETCHLVDGLKDGTKDVVRVNTNEYSPNYNDGASETINVPDLELCPLDPESPIWTEISYTCVLDEGYRTGYVTVVEEDTNPQSASYGVQRTRTYQDEERCPYQEKPQPVTLKWRVINNRGASTDTITSITLHFNSNFDIDILGSISPVGGMLQGTTLLPASLTATGLVCATIDLSPNTSSPTIFQFSQTPNPFVWDNTSGSAVLAVTLWDGDGTGPEWAEVSYTCETVDGYRTGAAIVVEEDMNPNSATYGQTRTRTIESDSRCPAQTDGDWVETSWSCQQESGYNTGYRISVQTDQNPNSSTYGSTRTRLIYDTTNCPLDTTAAWTEISYVCEQQDGFNTGNTIITERDVNPGSATYNTTRTRTVSNDPRCVRDTNPNWVEVSWVCEEASTLPDWQETSRTCIQQDGYNTGYAIVVETDMNPYSQTYQQTRTSTVQDTTTCPLDTTPNWVEQSRTCEKDGNNENTGNAIVVELDTNPYSSSYNTTRTRTVQDLTNCPLPTNFKLKFRIGTASASPRTIACDGSTTLTRSEINSAYSSFWNNIVTADIGSCVTTIGEQAFYNCSKLTTVTLPNTLITIGREAFAVNHYLTSITIPDSVTTIGVRAFQSTDLTSITIPDSVTLIDEEAFDRCVYATSITLGSGLTEIRTKAFNYCTVLQTITSYATTPPTLGTNAVANIQQYPVTVYVPAQSISAYQSEWGTMKFQFQAIQS